MTTVNPGFQVTNIKAKSTPTPRWRRVLFKISGAALACTGPNNIDPKVRFVNIVCNLVGFLMIVSLVSK